MPSRARVSELSGGNPHNLFPQTRTDVFPGMKYTYSKTFNMPFSKASSRHFIAHLVHRTAASVKLSATPVISAILLILSRHRYYLTVCNSVMAEG